ncbi:MAG: hypothetical protein WA915_01685 [Candidatus Aminicenantaceae bacterium]
MKNKVFLLWTFVVFLCGCSKPVVYNLQYDFVLGEVVRPAEATELLGEQKMSTTEEEDYTYIFEDGMIKILWLPSVAMFEFLLENKTNSPIKIIWNEAAYVCEKGDSHKIIHAGVKYSQRNRHQMPSAIEPKSRLKDFVYPADYMSFVDEGWIEKPLWSGNWEGKPLLPTSQKGGDPQEFLNSAKSSIGRTIQVLLPIRVEDVTYDYTFIFRVRDVNLWEEK